jgi:hypothetical protein
MKSVRAHHLQASALAFVLVFTTANLFAQARVPVGPPGAPGNHFTLPTGPLPAPKLAPPPSLSIHIGQSYDGIDFNGSNCGCLPPDTNAAVGGNYVAEAVNIQFRVFDKTTGAVLLDEPLSTLFGAATGGDPYVLYDDTVGRWYVTGFDSPDTGLFLAVSNDSSPLDGFQIYDLTGLGGFPDYQKPGYTKDAIFIGYNDFGTNGGYIRIASIDKAAILGGTLTYYVNTPANQFRAMPPAQMHGDKTGGVEWFVSTDGTDAGGTSIRVTKMTNYLSTSPVFTYTSLPVAQYQQATTADQPGGAGSVTVFPNTTTTQVHYRSGKLLTAMASGTAKDGFVYPKGLYYRINVKTGIPVLLKQGVIDPGPGVAVQMVTIDQDKKGHLGLTWIESSASEYLSMWIGNGTKTVKADAAPGGGFFAYGYRIGDYSSTVMDPSDGLTFWSANEYIGFDGSTDIWRTHLTSFKEF